ncbi:MAG: DMT family transporter [Solirubrobacteraceae bacterium]
MTPRQVGLLGLLAAIWGGSYLLIKYCLEGFSAPVIVCGRSLLGAGVLLLAIRLQGGATWEALHDARRRPWTALGLGAVAIAGPFLLITVGEQEVPSGLTAVLIASVPLFVALFAPFLDRSEQIDRRQGVGLAVGILGVGLLVGVESVSTLGQFLGAMAMIGAAACYALSSFVVKAAYRGIPAIVTSFVSVGAGALITLPPALADLPSEAPGLRAVLALVGLGALGTAAAFVIFYKLIGELGAGRAALVSYLAPPLALAYGAALLDEPITPAAIAGTVLILAGVALASRRRARPDHPVSRSRTGGPQPASTPPTPPARRHPPAPGRRPTASARAWAESRRPPSS